MREIERRIEELGKGDCPSSESTISVLLEELRDEKYKDKWFRSLIVREFLNKHVAGSGVVPEAIVEAVETSNRDAEHRGVSASARQKFIDSIDGNGSIKNLQSFSVSGNALMNSAKSEGEVMKTFAQRNIHNSRYYYTKFTEWFITKCYISEIDSPVVVDIGSAYNGFGRYAKNATNAKEINLVDILNPPGRIQLEERIYQVGSDAVKIDIIPSDYADIICLHNAIEHFACGSDNGCLGELERMLRPGGKALISPFFFEGQHAISLNPISCFFYDTASESFVDYLVHERNKNGAILRYSYGMISPYAHVYDYPTIERKLKENCPGLTPKLHKVFLKDEKLESEEVFGVKFYDDLYDKPTFFFLELENTVE
jgi:SAM-dependent methyltransferase